MNLIAEPKNLAERIVNAVCSKLYQHGGFDFDTSEWVSVREEMATELTSVVQKEIDARPDLQKVADEQTAKDFGDPSH